MLTGTSICDSCFVKEPLAAIFLCTYLCDRCFWTWLRIKVRPGSRHLMLVLLSACTCARCTQFQQLCQCNTSNGHKLCRGTWRGSLQGHLGFPLLHRVHHCCVILSQVVPAVTSIGLYRCSSTLQRAEVVYYSRSTLLLQSAMQQGTTEYQCCKDTYRLIG